MPPIRNVGPRIPSAVGSADVPTQPQAPSQPATRHTGASGRSVFESRPPQSTDRTNSTLVETSASLGAAFDMRKAGRAVDTNLLYELSRYEKGTMPERMAIAELAAMGAIDAKAMEQITNNTNFEGWKLPVEDRLAFALLMNTGESPAPISRYPMNTGKPTFEVVAKVLGKPAGGAWLEEARGQAKELLAASKSGKLLESPTFAAVLRSHAPATSALPAGLSSSPRAVRTFDIATKAGANADQAKALAEKAAAGQLDVVTLQTLAPKGGRESVAFTEQYGTSAIAPKVSLEDAAKIAGSVAKGELDFAQLHGFMLKFGATDDWPRANFSVATAVSLITSMNKGELTEAGLAKALEPNQYFPGQLTNKIWDHFFSGRDDVRGNHFTVDGAVPPSTWIAPFMSRLEPAVVKSLANDDGKRATFAKALQEKISEGLPHGLGVVWDRLNGNESEPEKKYGLLMDAAIAHARQTAGI
jgi:hypothetical protein